jgi:hypothetical protein
MQDSMLDLSDIFSMWAVVIDHNIFWCCRCQINYVVRWISEYQRIFLLSTKITGYDHCMTDLVTVLRKFLLSSQTMASLFILAVNFWDLILQQMLHFDRRLFKSFTRALLLSKRKKSYLTFLVSSISLIYDGNV